MQSAKFYLFIHSPSPTLCVSNTACVSDWKAVVFSQALQLSTCSQFRLLVLFFFQVFFILNSKTKEQPAHPRQSGAAYIRDKQTSHQSKVSDHLVTCSCHLTPLPTVTQPIITCKSLSRSSFTNSIVQFTL